MFHKVLPCLQCNFEAFAGVRVEREENAVSESLWIHSSRSMARIDVDIETYLRSK